MNIAPKNKIKPKALKVSREKSYKLILREWSLASSAQCLPKIFQYDNVLVRVIFVFILLVFLCGTFLLLVRALFDYFSYDVVSQIRIYDEATLTYPVITICDANPFTSKEAEEILKEFKIEEANLYQGFNPENLLGDPAIQSLTSKFFLYLSYGMYKAFELNDEKKQKLSNSLKSSIKFCTFDNEPCEKNDFVWYFSYLYGNCFMFNSNTSQLKKTKMSGSLYGLVLLLGNLTSQNKYPTSYASGLKVFVTNTSFLAQSSQQKLVETSKFTSIEIRKTIAYREPYPYSQCKDLSDFKSELHDQLKKSVGKYRQTYCFELCLQRLIILKCKCFLFVFPSFDNQNFKPCFTLNDSSCYFEVIMKASSKLEEKCILECPLECDYVRYDLSSSALNFPNEEFFKILKNSSNEYAVMSIDEFKQKYLLLNVFYVNKEYTEMKEIPKISLIDLVSNLGGVVGVFLGLSIFTLIEIMELIIQLVFACFKSDFL
jgi:hypothetical protein